MVAQGRLARHAVGDIGGLAVETAARAVCRETLRGAAILEIVAVAGDLDAVDRVVRPVA